ncbi:hypothetical protein JRO89_XS02G0081600 [Xanthoceras sorbifolium]|uniref:Protein unc-50 homolog n=1 Tax=Xanthoceras sorbifolium TaxID=99658 RepID=A0ABQ8IF65_9ROSI|nr:hypothetical protein JRO89_XS02G0081600 [Xanthoceras sorbifolium]
MLPTSVSKGRSSSATSRANPMFPQYLRRIIKVPSRLLLLDGSESCFTSQLIRDLDPFYICIFWQQMDIEYTFWQMLHLCTSPKVVYQHTKYHKRVGSDLETKNQWARDDPAFVVICSLLLSVATMAYCAAYDHSAAHAVFVVISVLLFHFLITGAILATCCWFLTNAYLREESPNSHVVEQRVEWLYAFDVHCNSFFPMFVMLHVIHYFLSPLLVAHGFIPILLSNLLFMVAASYYHYLNFLGYDVLPFLERTTFFLYPIGIVIVLSPILILSGFNPSRYFMNMYFSKRL